VTGQGIVGETPAVRLKRLKMRSWRRGTKEMDLILGRFADAHLGDMGRDDLAVYDALLNEVDTDLYQWLTGQGAGPPALQAMLRRIAASAKTG